jgi:hypothetical protein
MLPLSTHGLLVHIQEETMATATVPTAGADPSIAKVITEARRNELLQRHMKGNITPAERKELNQSSSEKFGVGLDCPCADYFCANCFAERKVLLPLAIVERLGDLQAYCRYRHESGERGCAKVF